MAKHYSTASTLSAGILAFLVVCAANISQPRATSAQEKSEFTVVLVDAGNNKLEVLKELRALAALSLKEAKDLVDGETKTIKGRITKDDAARIKIGLEKLGAKVEVIAMSPGQ